MNYLINLDAWLSALVFAGLMIISWGLGLKMRSFSLDAEAKSTRIEDGALALFGLLLAFCFSGAAGRYEARKELLRDDVIAIGELADVGSMLAEPERSELHQEIQRYVQQRIRFGQTRPDMPEMQKLIDEGQASQARMKSIIRRIVSEQKTPTIHGPLLSAFNGLTTADAKRLSGVRDQINGNILLMLVLFGMLTTLTMGRLQEPGSRFGFLRISFYIGLVALVYFVLVDMEQPRRGLILVNQTSMQELSRALQPQEP